MKRSLLFIAALLAGFSSFGAKKRVSNTLPAQAGLLYNTIQDAIDDCEVGDTIYVEGSAQPYDGFLLNKPLTIIGMGVGLSDPNLVPSQAVILESKIDGVVNIQGLNLYDSPTLITGLSSPGVDQYDAADYILSNVSDLTIYRNQFRYLEISNECSNVRIASNYIYHNEEQNATKEAIYSLDNATISQLIVDHNLVFLGNFIFTDAVSSNGLIICFNVLRPIAGYGGISASNAIISSNVLRLLTSELSETGVVSNNYFTESTSITDAVVSLDGTNIIVDDFPSITLDNSSVEWDYSAFGQRGAFNGPDPYHNTHEFSDGNTYSVNVPHWPLIFNADVPSITSDDEMNVNFEIRIND